MDKNKIYEIINCLTIGTVFYLNGDKYIVDVKQDDRLKNISSIVYYDVYGRKTLTREELNTTIDDNVIFIVGYAGTKFQIS